MEKKGFTLVELLAVIVILAIIAIIATPIILNVIETAKKGAAENSALGYLDSVEKQIAINMVDSNKTNDITSTGILDVPVIGVNVKGTEPTKGWIELEKGNVKNYSMVIGEYVVTKGEETKKGDTVATKPSNDEVTSFYSNGTAIYYNPETNTKCNESEAISNTGTKTGCMKWYTFNDIEGSTTVNMILDHNTTAMVAWNSSGNNADGMNEVASALIDDTSTWISNLNARLIEADEIAKITGNTTFNQATSTSNNWFYFDSNNQTQTANSSNKSLYAWLYDYTYDCTIYGCNIEDSATYGYWTSTPVVGTNVNAWRVDRDGYLHYNHSVDITIRSGLRPVITISKSIIA